MHFNCESCCMCWDKWVVCDASNLKKKQKLLNLFCIPQLPPFLLAILEKFYSLNIHITKLLYWNVWNVLRMKKRIKEQKKKTYQLTQFVSLSFHRHQKLSIGFFVLFCKCTQSCWQKTKSLMLFLREELCGFWGTVIKNCFKIQNKSLHLS